MSIHQANSPFIRVNTSMPLRPLRQKNPKRHQIPINFMYHALSACGWDKIIALVKKP